MADQNSNDSTQSSAGSKIFVILFALIALIFGGVFAYSIMQGDPDIVVETEDVNAQSAYTQESEEVTETVEDSEAASVTTAETTPFTLDLAQAKTERILGDRSAPIKISEHSSFSCGHCGRFHRDVLPVFKARYIDTGKAYIVFSDFPLNAPALQASMVGRCLPDTDNYFSYVDDVFADQDEWAYDATQYMPYLKSKATEYGLSEDGFNACVQSEELQEALLKRIRAVQERYDIRSTPSFVINNQKIITGVMDVDQFIAAIEAAVAEIEAETAAAEQTPQQAQDSLEAGAP